MRTVSAREANQQFSRILDAVVQDEEITITRRGVPVAKVRPIKTGPLETQERQRREDILVRFDRRSPSVRDEKWTPDELYLERFERPRVPENEAHPG